jgi:hypothetical protein
LRLDSIARAGRDALSIVVIEGRNALSIVVIEGRDALSIVVIEGRDALSIVVIEGRDALSIVVIEGRNALSIVVRDLIFEALKLGARTGSSSGAPYLPSNTISPSKIVRTGRMAAIS